MKKQPGNSHVVAEAIASFAVALSALGMAVSLAALVFTGPLAAGLPRAIGGFVIAGAIVTGLIAWRSEIVPAVALVQDGPAVVLTAVAARVAAGSSTDAVSDVFVLLALSTFATALIMWLFGRFRLGYLVRYMPSTVVAAFIAGTGYLLTKGGIDVMVGAVTDTQGVGDLFETSVLKLWVPGVLLGIAILMVQRSDRLPPVSMSITIVAALVAFYAIVGLSSSVRAVEAGGWLMGPFADDASVELVSAAEVANANWSDLVPQLPGVLSVIAVAVLALLLNLTGLEVVSGRRVDVDRELRSTGVANLFMALFGSPPGFHALGDTVLVHRMGATRRLVGLAAAVIMLSFGLFAIAWVGYVPRLLVGALLVTVGVALLIEWAEGLARSSSRFEQFLSLGIVVVIALVGILEGIAVGIVATCAVFIIRYSRVDPVRRVASRQEMASRVARTPSEATALADAALRTRIFELQGYLFFGSLTSLDAQLRDVCDEAPDLDAVILDFGHVTGIDSSGFSLLGRLVKQVEGQGAECIISGRSPKVRGALETFEPLTTGSVVWFDTLDQALEHVEDAHLATGRTTSDGHDDDLGLSAALLERFTEVTFRANTTALAQGAPGDEMFIVGSGSLTAWRIEADGTPHRLRRFGAGALIGEIGLITGGVRTAEVTADTDVEALSISREVYRSLRASDPDLAIELHEFILRRQAERVATVTDTLTQALR